ncbi:hypothetical protein BDR03DRAFT_953547 [Suillus americanus]|nr:hypothetical protein BDR03DRAFT_953547 [Suillus americanus]
MIICADESELLSTWTLAITRYRRNHELMEEVFRQLLIRTLLTISIRSFSGTPLIRQRLGKTFVIKTNIRRV